MGRIVRGVIAVVVGFLVFVTVLGVLIIFGGWIFVYRESLLGVGALTILAGFIGIGAGWRVHEALAKKQ